MLTARHHHRPVGQHPGRRPPTLRAARDGAGEEPELRCCGPSAFGRGASHVGRGRCILSPKLRTSNGLLVCLSSGARVAHDTGLPSPMSTRSSLLYPSQVSFVSFAIAAAHLTRASRDTPVQGRSEGGSHFLRLPITPQRALGFPGESFKSTLDDARRVQEPSLTLPRRPATPPAEHERRPSVQTTSSH